MPVAFQRRGERDHRNARDDRQNTRDQLFRGRPVANRQAAFDRKRYRKPIGGRRQRCGDEMEGDQQSDRDHHRRRYAGRLPQREKAGSLASSQSRKRSLNVMAPLPVRTPAACSVSGMTTRKKQLKHAAARFLK